MEYIGKITLWIIAMVLGVMLGGLIVMKFWNWFILPAFDVPTLSFAHSIGLSMFLVLFKTPNLESKTDTTTAYITSFVYQLLILGFGWTISLFI